MTTVAIATVAGVSFGASASVAASDPAVHPAPASASVMAERSVSAHRQAPQVVTQVIGKGGLDGHRWSVAPEFHRTLPKGYTPPGSSPAPGPALLRQRMYIGNVRIGHQGGPWAGCQPVNGTHDPRPSGETGLGGLHEKGISGSRPWSPPPNPTSPTA